MKGELSFGDTEPGFAFSISAYPAFGLSDPLRFCGRSLRGLAWIFAELVIGIMRSLLMDITSRHSETARGINTDAALTAVARLACRRKQISKPRWKTVTWPGQGGFGPCAA
jgi:hypothetical protein